LEEVSSDWFSGEAAQRHIFLWRGFFIGSNRKEGASFQWREQERERAHQVLGAYLTGSCGKAHEELAMYTGSFVLYYLFYLML
jgi:hypothetical protein